MDIWRSNKWRAYYSGGTHRSGIRVDFEKGVNDEVKTAIKKLILWLRENYVFPKRIRIYVQGGALVKARDGSRAPDLFFWPDSRDDEPYIKIATGDYPELLSRLGRDDALATILCALLRELTHYFQWLNDLKLTPIGEQRQATRYGVMKLDEYSETTDHP